MTAEGDAVEPVAAIVAVAAVVETFMMLTSHAENASTKSFVVFTD
jgi:hypothetical protein